MAAMRRGDFERAWVISDRILAHRIARDGFDYTLPRHLQAIWDGRSLANKHVLVRCYHGLGDTIQFIRFAKPLHAIAREVSVWVQPPLVSLVSRVNGVDRVLPLHDGAPEIAYDADIEIMEIAHALRARPETLAIDVPYVEVPARKLEPLRDERLRVGVIWSAGDWDARRSLQLSMLEPLMQIPDVQLIILQRGAARADAQSYALHDLGSDDIETFAATLAALDLLICVDTFGAHLAGAMNVPAWILLQKDCDWRWMSEGCASLWYPSVRLFRQHSAGEWDPVVAEVAAALRARSAAQIIRAKAKEQTHRCDVRTVERTYLGP
jgi:hypothetical protein